MAKISCTILAVILLVVTEASVFDKMYKDTVLRVLPHLPKSLPVMMQEDLENPLTKWPPAFCNKLDCPKYTVMKKKPVSITFNIIN